MFNRTLDMIPPEILDQDRRELERSLMGGRVRKITAGPSSPSDPACPVEIVQIEFVATVAVGQRELAMLQLKAMSIDTINGYPMLHNVIQSLADQLRANDEERRRVWKRNEALELEVIELRRRVRHFERLVAKAKGIIFFMLERAGGRR